MLPQTARLQRRLHPGVTLGMSSIARLLCACPGPMGSGSLHRPGGFTRKRGAGIIPAMRHTALWTPDVAPMRTILVALWSPSWASSSWEISGALAVRPTVGSAGSTRVPRKTRSNTPALCARGVASLLAREAARSAARSRRSEGGAGTAMTHLLVHGRSFLRVRLRLVLLGAWVSLCEEQLRWLTYRNLDLGWKSCRGWTGHAFFVASASDPSRLCGCR